MWLLNKSVSSKVHSWCTYCMYEVFVVPITVIASISCTPLHLNLPGLEVISCVTLPFSHMDVFNILQVSELLQFLGKGKILRVAHPESPEGAIIVQKFLQRQRVCWNSVIMVEPVSIMPLFKLFLPHTLLKSTQMFVSVDWVCGAQFHECQRKQLACISHCSVFVMLSLGMEMMD